MPLQDLIISNKKISEDLLEKILRGNAELIQEGKKVLLTKKGSTLPGRTKILLFLAGGSAWSLLDNSEWKISPSDLEGSLGIPGNTLRPTLKTLSDNYLVKSEAGKYRILPKGVYELETLFEDASNTTRAAKRTGRSLQGRSFGVPSKSEAIMEMMKESFFNSPKDLTEIQTELGRRGMTTKVTSLPSYLLPLVRKKELARESKQKDKRKIWAYSLPAKGQI